MKKIPNGINTHDEILMQESVLYIWFVRTCTKDLMRNAAFDLLLNVTRNT